MVRSRLGSQMRLTSALLVWLAFAAATLAQQPAPAAPAADDVTFNRDVAPIFNKHCVACHRPGQMAPMSLLTHESARPWARSIQRQVTARTMPPWSADPGIGTWANDPSLSASEIATISRWVETGAAKGTTPAPEPPSFTEGWQIGTPDLVLAIPKPFPVPATGLVDYQYIEIPDRPDRGSLDPGGGDPADESQGGSPRAGVREVTRARHPSRQPAAATARAATKTSAAISRCMTPAWVRSWRRRQSARTRRCIHVARPSCSARVRSSRCRCTTRRTARPRRIRSAWAWCSPRNRRRCS